MAQSGVQLLRTDMSGFGAKRTWRPRRERVSIHVGASFISASAARPFGP